jgi:hypothetical protein
MNADERDKMTDSVLRIVYLQAENVKRLKAVRIRPDKTLVRIEGQNAAGKSSVLDAIAAALGGSKWNPDKPIREGAKKAKVVVDLDEIVVTRHWTPTRTYLDVIPKGGGPGSELPSPQAVLDKLMGDLTFDPLGFILMKPADQVSQLKRLAGLDFDKLDEQRAALFADRTAVNRDGKAAEARVGTLVSKPANMEPINTSKLAADYEKAMEHNRRHERLVQAAKDAETSADESERRCQELQDELSKAQATRMQLQDLAQLKARELNAVKLLAVGSLSEQMGKAETHNDAIVAYHGYEQRQKEADLLAASSGDLTERIEKLDEQKQTMLAEAKFPVKGLTFDAAGVSFKGIPLSQASSAEQLRIGVAIGLAQKPRARIMLCRNGSLLDDKSLQLLHDIAEEFDAQVFVERVAEEASPNAVFIEDGEVCETGADAPDMEETWRR